MKAAECASFYAEDNAGHPVAAAESYMAHCFSGIRVKMRHSVGFALDFSACGWYGAAHGY